MNQISFQSENLVVDWISFNIKDLTDPEPIAIYLSESFGFNSIITKGSKRKSESLVSEFENQYQVFFKQYDYNPELKSFWSRTKVSFSGDNATYFYSLIKEKKVDWNIFDLRYTTLSRFDLYYFRKPKPTDQKDHVELFMDQCCQKILAKSKRRYVSWSRNSKGLILKVGSRQSSNYYRVYEKKNGLEFELEMKNEVVKSVQEFLFLNHLKEFEDKLSKHFYRRSMDSLILDTCYTDWLVSHLRKTSKKQNSRDSLVTSYLENSNFNSLVEAEYFFKLLQFLSFIRYLKGSKLFVGNLITFPVADFLRVTGVKKKSQC